MNIYICILTFHLSLSFSLVGCIGRYLDIFGQKTEKRLNVTVKEKDVLPAAMKTTTFYLDRD
jgi:hypothetical protein